MKHSGRVRWYIRWCVQSVFLYILNKKIQKGKSGWLLLSILYDVTEINLFVVSKREE